MKEKKDRILVVDDDPGTIRLLEKALSAHGFEVITAVNGNSGLQRARKEAPDIILLDVMMPDLSGGEVAKLLQADPQTQKIPIVFISVILDKKGKKEIIIDDAAFPAVAKPFYQPELLSAIRKSLKTIV